MVSGWQLSAYSPRIRFLKLRWHFKVAKISYSDFLGLCVILDILCFLFTKGLPFKHLSCDCFNHSSWNYKMCMFLLS